METEPLHIRAEWQHIWQRRWWVLSAALTLGLLALLLSSPSLLPPEYLATANIAPPMTGELPTQRDPNVYVLAGKDRDIENLVALLTSDSCYNYMVREFGLVDHYGLRSSDTEHQYKQLRHTYDNKVEVQIGRLSSVVVAVYDTDPQLAARMANAFVKYAQNFIERSNHRLASVQALAASVAALEQRARHIADTLALLHNPHLVASYTHELKSLNEQLSEMRGQYWYQKQLHAAAPSLLHVLSYASVPRYPTRPRRWFIVVGCALLGGISLALVAVWLGRTRPAAPTGSL